MIFPLKELIEFKGNIYEITCAATRRAFQLVTIQDPILEENNDKVVSTAASQVFTGAIDYKIMTLSNDRYLIYFIYSR